MAVRKRLQRRRRRRNAVPRRLNDCSNPLESLNEAGVFDRYWFVPETIMLTASLMRDELIYQSHRNNPKTPLYQVLVALRYFARGPSILPLGTRCSFRKVPQEELWFGLPNFFAVMLRNSFDCLAEMKFLALNLQV